MSDMRTMAGWLRGLADTIDPQVPPLRLSGGLRGTEYRERFSQWLRDNGLDPSDIPEGAVIEVSGNTITTDVLVRNEAWKPETGGRQWLLQQVTVPLRKRWSDA